MVPKRIIEVIDPHQCFQFDDIQTQAEFISAKWHVPEDLPYLQGHFPGLPMVPAVAILDATTELLTQGLKQSLRLSQVKNAKFSKPLEPKTVIEIECRRIVSSVSNQEWSVDWKTAGDTIAKLLIVT